jgi:hypothetical protein
METAFGLQTGVELFSRVKWLAIGFEGILWKEIPAAISVNLLQWGVRTFGDRELSTSLTLLRIQFLWVDMEVYFVGGAND